MLFKITIRETKTLKNACAAVGSISGLVCIRECRVTCLGLYLAVPSIGGKENLYKQYKYIHKSTVHLQQQLKFSYVFQGQVLAALVYRAAPFPDEDED